MTCPKCKIKFDSIIKLIVNKGTKNERTQYCKKCSNCGFVNKIYKI